MQRCQRAGHSGRVDGLPPGEDLECCERPGEPAASPGAGSGEQQERAGDAGERQQPGTRSWWACGSRCASSRCRSWLGGCRSSRSSRPGGRTERIELWG